MMGCSICFKGVIWKIVPKLSLLPSYLEHWESLEMAQIGNSSDFRKQVLMANEKHNKITPKLA